MNKINLEVAKGNGFNEQNRFALKFDIKNFDTSAIPLSAVRITAYAWLQERNILGQFTSGVNAQGYLSQFTSSVDLSNGVGQTGIVSLDLSKTVYRVYHNVVNSSKIAPQLTINAPIGQTSQISPVAYTNNTDTYFDIVLDDAPPVPGYTITWFLPGSFEDYTGSTTPVSNPTISVQKVSEYIRNKNKKFDSKIVISWPGNTSLISQNWGLQGTDVYIQITPDQYPSSFVTSSWYSSPDDTLTNNPHFVLERFDGTNWNLVSEYADFNVPDTLTGVSATDQTFVKIINNGTGNNKSVYIATSGTNPISASYLDKNNLSLWSKGSSDSRRRSLVKFDTSAIPSSATGIKNAILRLNVNSLSNAWNYSSTNGHVAVYKVINDWTEAEATWNNRKSGTPWTTSGGDFLDAPAKWVGSSVLSNSFTSADQNNQFWMDFDVTDIVDSWRISPAQNYGFLVKLFDSTNENNSTSIKWELNSGRLSGTGPILGYPQLLVSYNVLNVNGPTPNITLLNQNNSNIFNTSFNLSGSTSISAGSVESVSAYYRQTNSVTPYQFFGILSETSQDSWNGVFNSLSVGSYDFILRAVSDMGNFGESPVKTIKFTAPPAVSATGDFSCNSGSGTITGFVDNSNGIPISGTVSYAKQFIPTSVKITSILEDRLNSNVVWIGTDGNGLYRIDKTSTSARVVNYTTKNSGIYYDSISDISMESTGIIWIAYTGKGLGTFDSRNWLYANTNSWYLYNNLNSSLSAYPANAIDICDVFVDSNDIKYFALTWNSIDSVIKLSGNTFTNENITKYNLGIFPRKVFSKGSYLYVATSDNRIFRFDGSTWNNYSLPSFKNINDISVDSSDTVWIATDSGIATLIGITITECQTSATVSWPNGIYSGKGHSQNSQAKSIIVAGSSKYISYSTGNANEYNGGVVKYTAPNLNSTNISGNNWNVIDKYNFSGLLSNNVYKSLYTSSNSLLWVVTDIGLCYFDGSLWQSFSRDVSEYPVIISGTSFSSTISDPLFGNNDYNLNLVYSDGSVYSNTFNFYSEQTPTISIKSPTNSFETVPGSGSQKILEFSVVTNDPENLGNVVTRIKKGPTVNGPWTDAFVYSNVSNLPVYDVLNPEDFYFFKVVAEGLNCSSESSVYSVYGSNSSTVFVNPVSGIFNSNSIVNFSGSVYNKDFSKNIIVNGVSYTDSLDSVRFGYVSGGNFVNIGNAILGNVVNSSATFTFDWSSPVVGVNQISAIATTKFGTVAGTSSTFNAILSVPSISILKPTTNEILPLNSSYTLSASTQSLTNVSALNYYINDGSEIFLGSATSGVNAWTYSFIPSTIVSGGNYTIYAKCTNISGTSSVSNAIPVVVNSLPTFTITSDLSATHSGTYTFTGVVGDSNNYFNNRIDIISGTSAIYTGYTNGFGQFTWNYSNPPSGTISLSAKVYDGSPTVSSDFRVVPFVLNLNKVVITSPTFNYPSAIKDGVVISPKVNVITTNTVIPLSANVVGNNVVMVDYILCNYDESTSAYYKYQTLTSGIGAPYNSTTKLPSSRYIENGVSKYKFWAIISEVVSTNGSVIDSGLSYFYVKEQSISGDISTSVCSDPLEFSGNYLDSDLPLNGSNAIIDNSVSATIYDATHNSYLGTLTNGIRVDENIPFVYSWANPLSSVSAVNLYIKDQYGISAVQNINYGGLDVNPTISINGTSSIAYSSDWNVYLVSAGNISLSSTTSATKIKSIQYIVTDENGQRIIPAINKSAVVNVSSTNLTTIQSYIQTSGNCVGYSSEKMYTTLRPISGNIYPDNCSNCYCNGGTLNIVGDYTDPNYSNYYLTPFNYKVSAYVYDNYNNLIQDISNQFTNTSDKQSWTASWILPTIGASLIILKIVDNLGNIQTFSKNLYRSILGSPSIVLTSPLPYTSGVIYRQDNTITFSVSALNQNVTGVKYYANDTLLGVSKNSSNGFALDWSIDKLPYLYTISAVAVNSDSGCYSIDSRNVMVSNPPVVDFVNVNNQDYYPQGTVLKLSIDSKGNYPANVSAVKVQSSPGSLVSATYNPTTRFWESSLSALNPSVSAYSVSAISYDTLGQVNKNIIQINVAKNTVLSASISGSNNITTNYNTVVPIVVSGSSVNGGTISGAYILVNGDRVDMNKISNSTFTEDLLIPKHFEDGSTNVITVVMVDTLGGINSNNITINVPAYTGLISYPVIRNTGSDPQNKVTFR